MYKPTFPAHRRRVAVFGRAIELLEPRQLLAIIYGSFFEDVNHSGLFRAGEPGIAGRVAYADLNNNGALDADEPSAQSADDGTVKLDGGSATTFTVRQLPPPDGWTLSGATSYTTYFQDPRSFEFGSFPTGSTIPTGSISAFVFKDTNGNGIRDAGEPPARSAGLWIDFQNDGTLTNEKLAGTDDFGIAHFTNMRPGIYHVRTHSITEAQSTPGGDQSSTVTVAEGSVDAGEFGLAPSSMFSSIDGIVVFDKNDNGKWDSGEPASSANHLVYVDSNNNGQLDADEPRATPSPSIYRIKNLRPGTYIVRLLAAPGWFQTLPTRDGSQTVSTTAGQESSVPYFGANDREVGPIVISSPISFNSSPPTMIFEFSEDVGDSFTDTDMVLHNLTTNEDFPITVTYDSATRKATIPLRQTILSDGNYTATLPTGAVDDWRGKKMEQDYTRSFFMLKGDLNHDRSVSISDFIRLAGNMNRAGAAVSGDLNDDGFVSIADFVALTANFNVYLAPPEAPAFATTAMAPASASLIEVANPKKNSHHYHPSRRRVADLLS